MQQHSGEHIVSGLVHEAYGYNNVGFHMSSDVITIDFSGVLDERQLAEIEEKTNRKIWENKPVEIFYPDKEELAVLPYRSKGADRKDPSGTFSGSRSLRLLRNSCDSYRRDRNGQNPQCGKFP